MDQATRKAVEKFSVRTLMIDTVYPWTTEVSANVLQAFSRFFALVANAGRINRVPSLSVFVLGREIECVFPLQPVKSNIAKLMKIFQELKMEAGYELNPTHHKDTLVAAFEQIFSQFRRSFVSNKQQCASAAQLEICIITCQRTDHMKEYADKILQSVNVNFLKKVQVIHIKQDYQSASPLDKTHSIESPDREYNASNESVQEYFEFIELSNDCIELEYTFKSWLVENGVDDVQMIIDIKSGNDDGIVLKCDIHERLLSLSMVPYSQLKLFQSDIQQTQCSHCSARMQNAKAGTKMCHFKAVKLINNSGICESVVYGKPLILRPTSCWKLDWEELDVNQQKFQSIRTFLLQQEMCLLLESHEIVANSPKTFCILLPSDACGMLLKCVANIDVVLPLSNSLCIQKQSETIQTQIDELLIELPRTSSLNPLALKSGISDKLLEAFKPSETKKNPKAVKRQICDTDYRPNTKELARAGRSENMKSLSQKRAKCPYRPAFTKGSIMERALREFPDDFRANNEFL